MAETQTLGWDNRRGGRNVRDVQPGEYGNLLMRYRVLAERLRINPPPPLRLSPGPALGSGAHGTLEAVTVTQRLLEVLTPQEVDAVLAHELGHVRDQRARRDFRDWRASETSADTTAVEVVDGEVAIRALTRLERVQTEEMIVQAREAIERYRRVNPAANIPPLSQAQIDRLRRDQQGMLEWRIAGIRNAMNRNAWLHPLLPDGNLRYFAGSDEAARTLFPDRPYVNANTSFRVAEVLNNGDLRIALDMRVDGRQETHFATVPAASVSAQNLRTRTTDNVLEPVTRPSTTPSSGVGPRVPSRKVGVSADVSSPDIALADMPEEGTPPPVLPFAPPPRRLVHAA